MNDLAQVLGNWGEFIGSVGVLITLVYLAVQIRTTRSSINGSTQQSISDTSAHLFAVLAESEGLAAAFSKANRGESLTDIERIRVNSWWMSVLRHAENMHYQWQQDHLSEALLASAIKRITTGLNANTFAGRIWVRNKSDFNPPFVDYLDAQIAAISDVPTDQIHPSDI